MSTTDPIVFGRPLFDSQETEAVTAVLASAWIGQGPVVELFEHELTEYLGARHVVAVSSCTAALHLALVAIGVGPGDEVISTPFTFVATINAIEHCGATPVLVDIDGETLNLAPEAVAARITRRTRAVLPVHFGGRPIDVAGFRSIIDEHELWLIEDAAHAIGAIADDELIGASSHHRSISCFSFYPNKNLATAEGGAIALDDATIAKRLRSLRLHGLENDAWDRYRSPSYSPALATTLGFKYNMTDLQAAIARVQLTKLEGFLASRHYLATIYDDRLSEVERARPVSRAVSPLHDRHGLHLYQIRLDEELDRDAIVDQLRRRGIGAAVHYIGINQHPYYRHKFCKGTYPVSDAASRSLISLPLHPGMMSSDVNRVVDELADLLR